MTNSKVLSQQNIYAVTAQATALQTVLTNDFNTYLLTADDIENQVNVVRASIQDCISDVEYWFGIDAQPLIVSLNRIANLITQLGKQLLLTSPVIVTYTVINDFEPCCMIAHKLYQDYTRQDDILRLNPSIQNPNFILMGTVLRVFAQ